jgi:MFS family permease
MAALPIRGAPTPRRAWLVLIAVTAILFFSTGATFPSMGIPLFAMAGEFHWSQAASGASFLALGVVCAATALTPMALIPRIGGRWTVVIGTLVLAAGFLLAAVTVTPIVFYAAAALFGISISLAANSTGTYLIAHWFGVRSDRMIGIYMMAGLLGGAIMPPVAEALTGSHGGWRLYWVVMAGVAVSVAILCALFIREPPIVAQAASVTEETSPAEGWGYRAFLATPQFIVLAAAMVGTQLCIVTVSAVTVPHFANLGWPEDFAAEILGLQGLVGSIATGVSGWLTERWDAKKVLMAGLIFEAAGTLLLAFAHSLWAAYLFVPVFGIGWSVASLAATVLLIRYFGGKSGSAALSVIWMLAGFATAGPYIAGLIADLTGSFVIPLSLCGLVLIPVAVAVLWIDGPYGQRTQNSSRFSLKVDPR